MGMTVKDISGYPVRSIDKLLKITPYSLMGQWIKVHPDQPKSYKFVCSNCGGMIHSTALDKTKKVSICTYRYCPHCGKPMEVFR